MRILMLIVAVENRLIVIVAAAQSGHAYLVTGTIAEFENPENGQGVLEALDTSRQVCQVWYVHPGLASTFTLGMRPGFSLSGSAFVPNVQGKHFRHGVDCGAVLTVQSIRVSVLLEI